MHIFSKIKALNDGEACLRRKFLGEKTTFKKNVPESQFLMKMTTVKMTAFFENLSKNEWAQQGPTNEWPQQGPTNEWAQGPGPTGPNK